MIISILKALCNDFYRFFKFFLVLLPAIITGGCDLFNYSLVDHFLDNTEIVRVTGLTVKTPYATDGETILIPPGEPAVLEARLLNPRNFTVRLELLGAPSGTGSFARQIGQTEIEAHIAGAAEGSDYELILAMQSPDGLRDFPSFPLRIRCVSFETKLRDLTLDGANIPAFDPAQDAFQVNVPYSRSTIALGGTTEHPEAAIEFYAGADDSGRLLGTGKHTLEQNLELAVGDNHFYAKITAPSAATQGYALVVRRSLASETGIESFYFVLDAKNYGIGPGVVPGSGAMIDTAITISLPYGTDISSLSAKTLYTGDSISPDPGLPASYANPVVYTVTAAEGVPKTYTVRAGTANIASLGDISFAYGFLLETGKDISGIIKTEAITAVAGTDSLGTAIVLKPEDYSVDPLFLHEGEVKVTATLRVPADKSSTGEALTKSFDVYVSNDRKEINAFYFAIDGKQYGVGAGVENGSGSISGDAITVTLPYGTDLKGLTATVDYTGASIDPDPAAPADYSGARTYRVTATDGTTRIFTVTVNTAPGITIGGILVEGLAALNFEGIPVSPVAASTTIAITIIGGVTPDSWYVDINGPATETHATNSFSAPLNPGFYNVNVIATVGGANYSGSFGLTVDN